MAQVMEGIPCMCCGKLVPEAEGRIFARAFGCPSCVEMAERFMAKGKSELRRSLLLFEELVRVGFLEGKLQYGTFSSLDEVPKEDVLKMIVKMTEAKNAPPRPAGS